MYIMLSTTRDHIWVRLKFKIIGRTLPYRKARDLAIDRRLDGYLARVRSDPMGGYLVAVRRPRKNAPRPADLEV